MPAPYWVHKENPHTIAIERLRSPPPNDAQPPARQGNTDGVSQLGNTVAWSAAFKFSSISSELYAIFLDLVEMLRFCVKIVAIHTDLNETLEVRSALSE